VVSKHQDNRTALNMAVFSLSKPEAETETACRFSGEKPATPAATQSYTLTGLCGQGEIQILPFACGTVWPD